MRRLAEELGETAPSYSAVYDIVRGLPVDLVTLAHEGTKAYSDAFDLVHRREATGPNASVINSPGTVSAEIRSSRNTLHELARRPLRLEKEEALESIRRRDEEHQATLFQHDWLTTPFPELKPTYGEVARDYIVKDVAIPDPTTLILIDEADRLRMAGLEQVRSIFDASQIGLILIGMPGLEKRLARYPQFYSRIGFVHEFRPLGAEEIRRLLEQRWTPPGVHLPQHPLDPETVATIIRITGGNFRLLNRLLTQMERILEINALKEVTKAVVEAARQSLVIGEA